MSKRYEIQSSGQRGERRWSVWENDGSPDGRLVGASMVERDARQIADLLNATVDSEGRSYDPTPEGRDDEDDTPGEKTVRVVEAFGACRVLGPLIADKGAHFTYRDPEGKTKTAKKDAKARHAGFPRPRPHVEPCVNCADHPESRYGPGSCMHGNRAASCERCMSM